MRLALHLGFILLPAALLTTGCSTATPASNAAPATATTPSLPAPSPSAPSTLPSPSGTGSATATSVTPLVLGPNGLGSLRLGMSSKEATATGLITGWKPNPMDDCTLRSQLRGTSGREAFVYYSKSMGVEIIDAYGAVQTPEGIHIGSSKAAMLRAYPEWTNVEPVDAHADGRGQARVRGNHKAVYRIVTQKGKVTELTLQNANQSCYE